jgi:hypothetical protein
MQSEVQSFVRFGGILAVAMASTLFAIGLVEEEQAQCPLHVGS